MPSGVLFARSKAGDSEEDCSTYEDRAVLGPSRRRGMLAECAGNGTLKKYLGVYGLKVRLWPSSLRVYPRLRVLYCQSLRTDVHRKTCTQKISRLRWEYLAIRKRGI